MRNSRDLLLVSLGLLCAFFAGAAFFRVGPAVAQQAASPTYAGSVSQNNRFIAATGSVGSGMSVLWLVDTEAKRVLVYGTNSMGKNVELRAARNIEWDVKLEYFNDDSQFSVEDMRRFAEKQKQPPSASEKEKDKEKGSPPQPGGK